MRYPMYPLEDYLRYLVYFLTPFQISGVHINRYGRQVHHMDAQLELFFTTLVDGKISLSALSLIL